MIHTLLGLAAALRAGLPPAEARSQLDAVVPTDPDDDGRPSPRRTGRRHLEATLLEAEGDPAAALDVYRQVLDHHELYRAPFLLADCHQGAARCLLALGDQEGATGHARRAARLLARWPGGRRDEAAALLRRLGHGPTPTPPADPTPLTPANARSPPSWPKASPTARSPAASTPPPSPHRCTSPTSWPSST